MSIVAHMTADPVVCNRNGATGRLTKKHSGR